MSYNSSHQKNIVAWKIQAANKATEIDNDLLKPNYSTSEWHSASTPSTVLGTLVENGVYKNPFFGKNLGTIDKEPFLNPWWYRSEFELSENEADQHAILDFDGINYRADIFFNGYKITGEEIVYGAFRRFSFDVSEFVKAGINILAVKVFPPVPGDFSIGYVDWNPAPPDGNMGLFRPVRLRLNGGISVENPFVESNVNLETLDEASLNISAEVNNYTKKSISGYLFGKIETIEFSKKIDIPADTKQLVTFTAKDFQQLKIKNPRLWWPINLGDPNLYTLDLQFRIDERVLDTIQTRFGIREVEDYWLNDIHRGFKVNGQKVMIKGGGWTDDLFLMDTDDGLETQVKYVKQMNLNCIRLEGFWGKNHKLYDLCDEHGILLMVGWSCHWEHELHLGVPVDERFGGVYKPEHIEHISQAWEDQIIWLRNHPSIFVWTVASDKVPITALEQKYIETFTKYDTTRPYLNSTGGVGSEQHVIGAEDVISDLSGSSGVKMLGPYAYTAPIYWFTDNKLGGAYGFNTETGPGAQVPPLESLKKMIPEDQLWPIGEIWNYHCGRYEFADLSRFNTSLNARYGASKNIEEFNIKAQAMNYELMRPMFEAFQINKKRATGVIQWMLNAAWPKMYWQLYDHYLMPNGAFYGTQKACMPLNLIYNYGNNQVYILNDYLHSVNNLQARIRVYDINSEVLFEKYIPIDSEPDSSESILQLEELSKLTSTYFLDLRLFNDTQKEISNNFYWLSTKEEILDYEADLGEFAYHTPSKEYADLTLLNSLPKVKLEVNHRFEKVKDNNIVIVEIKNSSDKIAFLIDLKILHKKTGEIILPVFWEDNYFSLLPGEEKTVSATFNSESDAELKISGWNV